MRRLAVLFALVAAGAFAAPAVASSSNDQFAEVRARSRSRRPRRRGRRCRGDRGPRACVRPRPDRVPRPLRARRGAAPAARPEPRARPGVQVRQAPQRDPRRRPALGAAGGCCRDPPGLAMSTGRSRTRGSRRPLLAFAFSFTILFREGLEAVLLLAILLGSLEAGRASEYRKPLAARRRSRRSSRRPRPGCSRPSSSRSRRCSAS